MNEHEFFEPDEDEQTYNEARLRFRRNEMIDALAVFFPDLPELEGRVLLGVTSY